MAPAKGGSRSEATYRWVHVDNVAAGRSPVFEDARTGWLKTLCQGDSLLPDDWEYCAYPCY